jgi:hypothetical protein
MAARICFVLIQRSGSGKPSLRSLDEFAPDFVTFAKVLALPGSDRLPESSESAAAIAKSIESAPEAARKENQPAVYSFFLSGLESAAQRLRNFIEKAAQATLVGEVFDDAATGQGLLNYFQRAINCGAITVDEAQSLTSLTLPDATQRVVRKDSGWPQEIGAPIIPFEVSLRSAREVHRLAEKLHRDCPSRKAQD